VLFPDPANPVTITRRPIVKTRSCIAPVFLQVRARAGGNAGYRWGAVNFTRGDGQLAISEHWSLNN